MSRVASQPAPAQDPIVASVAAALSGVSGVTAVAVGGSRAIGTADAGSDYDIIAFESRLGAINKEQLNAAASRLAGPGVALSPNGNLVNLTISGQKVEILVRSLDVIAGEIEAARQGIFKRTLHPLHPIGYLTTIIISYVVYALPVHDPEHVLRDLIRRATPYPEMLRSRMISTFRTEAEFALIHASKVRSPLDLPYLTALYAQAIACWQLMLFAINRRYPVIDKGGMRLIMGMPQHPQNFQFRTMKMLRDIASEDLQTARTDAVKLHREIIAFR
ncbi:hypothetical protein [Parvibaculum sp.]|uniref:hypothetical protein n=1 Tax=Parvibaculum sp. TaxID=2024848 RepID=UPI0032114E57